MKPTALISMALAILAVATTTQAAPAVEPAVAAATPAAPAAAPVSGTPFSACTQTGVYSLTFDDGPFTFTSKLLDTLKAANATATFFVNGFNNGCIYDYADVILRAVNEGHQIASHTWSHPHLATLSDDAVEKEITKLEDALRKITGKVPAYLRPPFGEYNDKTLAVINKHGLKTILWDTDTGDGNRNGLKPEIAIATYDAALNFPTSHLALNHDIWQTTVDKVIPDALPKIKTAGYSYVSAAACLGFDQTTWYKESVAPGVRDATWTCTA